MTQTGDVPSVRLGGCVLYPVELLREWLKKEAAGQGSTGGSGNGDAPSYIASSAKTMKRGGR